MPILNSLLTSIGYKCLSIVPQRTAATQSRKAERSSTILCVSIVTQKHVFEGYSNTLDESEEAYFKQYIPDCDDPSSEFISFMPELSSGIELASITCFRHKREIFAMTIPGLIKSALLELIQKAEELQLDSLYMILPRELANFMKLFRMLSYLGFKQVPPDIQEHLCKAPAVLMVMKLSQ